MSYPESNPYFGLWPKQVFKLSKHLLVQRRLSTVVVGFYRIECHCIVVSPLSFRSWPWNQSRDSSVGIALGYGLDDRGSRVRFLAGAGNFSLHHRVQNGSGAHPASYPMGTRGSFPGWVKRKGRDVDHLPPPSAEVKNAWSYTSIPPSKPPWPRA
jgi:hypothetical protein